LAFVLTNQQISTWASLITWSLGAFLLLADGLALLPWLLPKAHFKQCVAPLKSDNATCLICGQKIKLGH
jgi:hypothetical protein